MRGYEILALNQQLLEQLAELNISVTDIRYIGMYREHSKMIKEGHKVTYVNEYISQKYGVDRATIYRINKRFCQEVSV